jgi:predicted transporter
MFLAGLFAIAFSDRPTGQPFSLTFPEVSIELGVCIVSFGACAVSISRLQSQIGGGGGVQIALLVTVVGAALFWMSSFLTTCSSQIRCVPIDVTLTTVGMGLGALIGLTGQILESLWRYRDGYAPVRTDEFTEEQDNGMDFF